MSTPYPSSYPAQCDRLLRVVADAREAVDRGVPVDQWLATCFRRNKAFGSATRRLLGNSVFAFFRWRGWLSDATASDPTLAIIESHFLDSNECHPLIAFLCESRSLLLPGSLWGPLSIQDKALAQADYTGTPLPQIDALIPAGWVDQMAIPDGMDRAAFVQQCIDSFQRRPPTWLRCSTGVSDLNPSMFSLHSQVPGAVSVSQAMSRAQVPHGAEIQDLASQCVGWVCDARPGQYWWDMCAGSGGKSLHLAALMQGKGRLLATDIRSASVREWWQRARRQHLEPANFNAQAVDALQVNPGPIFDGILIDAPCSGIGMWSRNPDARWRTSLSLIQHCAEIQARLLRHAAPQVRVGGVLVYAVCTLTVRETLAQVESFNHMHPEFEYTVVTHPLTGDLVQGPLWIYPWQGPCGGMLICRWQRRA
jgi:16S rRNA (cytosine967-C5)-methyltransferase